MNSDRITFESELTVSEVVLRLARRSNYLNKLLASGRLNGEAERICTQELEALEWLIPRLRRSAQQEADR